MNSRRPARIGSQKPTVRTAPRYNTSAVDEAVKISASAGLVADEWQENVLRDALGEQPDGMWAANEVGLIVPRQNGKNAIVEMRELAGLFVFGEELIMHTAHEVKTALRAFKRIRKLIESTPELNAKVRRIKEANGQEGIELKSGAELLFVARSKGSGRGFTGDLIILDEAYALTAAHMEALIPALSAVPNSQAWYTSSPSLDAVSGAALMDIMRRGEAGDSEGLAYSAWGAPRGTDLDDLEWLYRVNPALGIRLSLAACRRERDAMTDEGYGRERLGIWPADGQQWAIITEAAWLAAVGAWGSHASQVSFCVEIAMDRSEAAVAVATRRNDGTRQVELARIDAGTSWVVPWIVERVNRWPVCSVVIDAGGPAGSEIAELEKLGVEVRKPTTRDYAAACSSLIDSVSEKDEDGNLLPASVNHTGQPQMTPAIAALTMRKAGDSNVFERRGRGFLASAAALALWGHMSADNSDYRALNNIW